MEIAFHCPNCSADLIYDESKKYTCCFCHTVLTPKDEVLELEGGYYVGDAWNASLYHGYRCENCSSEFIAKESNHVDCPICASSSVKDLGAEIGAMPRRAIPFTQTKAQAEEVFLDYIRNNSVVGKIMATEENASLLRQVYVPMWVFNYEVIANVRLNANIRNKANESTTIMGFNVPGQIMERLSPIRSSISRFQQNRKGGKDMSDMPTEYTTGGVLSWQGIPFDASGVLPPTVMTALQPYDHAKLAKLNERILGNAPILALTKDPIASMEEFMERIKKWTRQMIMDAHAASYEIVHFSDKTDYPLGIGELVLFPIWFMKSEYEGREFFFAMNGQNGEVEAKIPMAKMSKKSNTISYQQYWDKERCAALQDTHFEFNIHDPNIEILDYSFFEKPKNSRVTADGRNVAPMGASLDDVLPEEPVEEKPKTPAKTGLEVENLRTDKKLTKEEEAKRAREVTARLRVAAKETPKGDMSAAAEAPSWAKAVTPPPAMSNSNRPAARTLKPAAERPVSKVAAANKPIWERTEEEEEVLNSKPLTLADRIAQTKNVEPSFPVEEAPQQEMASRGIAAEVAAMREDRTSAEEYEVQANTIDSSEDIYEVPMTTDRFDEEAYQEIPMPKAYVEQPDEKEDESIVEPQEVPVDQTSENEDEELISNITFSFPKKKKSMYSGEPTMSGSSIPRRTEAEPEKPKGMAIMNSEYESGILPGGSLHREEDDEVREITPKLNATENYIGTDKNDRPLASRPVAPLAKQRGDVYVEEVEVHPELDENNRPLAKRPPAPLARVTDVEPSLEYLAEQPLDDDIHQMPSIEKQKSRWGDMPQAAETPAWAKPQQPQRATRDDRGSASRDERMAARMASPRERVRRPSREELMAQDRARTESAAARMGVALPEKKPLTRPGTTAQNMGRPGSNLDKDETMRASRPAYMAAVEQPKAVEETPEEEEVRPISSAFRPANRPAANASETSRPAAGRPGSARSSAAKEPQQKSVPLWERIPENDGSRPQWAAATAYEDERPRGSLSKPAGQVIDVEKPRTRPSVWRPDPDASVKEVLPGSFSSDEGEVREVPLRRESEEPREVPVRRSFVERQAVAEKSSSNEEVEEIIPQVKKPTRPTSGIEVEIPSIPKKQPQVIPVEEDDELEKKQESVLVERVDAPVEQPVAPVETPVVPENPVNERPRTFAQRRQMEEEERRRQIQSSFGATNTRPGASARAAAFQQEEEQPINRTYEPTQFENKPSVVASLDQLPQPLDDDSIHHLAKDDSVPALAREVDRVRDGVKESEKNAQRAIRDLPDYDPDGPSPFRR